MNKNKPTNIAELIRSGKKTPAVTLVKDHPDTAALLSKLVKKRMERSTFDLKKKRDIGDTTKHGQMKEVSDRIKQNLNDSENILQLFPDIELSAQILVSSILSPKDMIKTDLIYSNSSDLLAAELISKINAVVSKHMDDYYDVRKELPAIIKDYLFDKGSHVKLVLPESIVDSIINGTSRVSNESMKELFTKRGDTVTTQSMGFLGSDTKTNHLAALETFTKSSKPLKATPEYSVDRNDLVNVEITDNFLLLKLPKVRAAAIKEKVYGRLRKHRNISNESLLDHFKSMDLNKIESSIYKSSNQETETMMVVPSISNVKRKSIGRPLVMTLPSEAVIPIYVPGSPKSHIGYFILTDEDGNPITRDNNKEFNQGLSSLANSSNSSSTGLSSSLVAKANRNLTDATKQPTVDHLSAIYANIIETELMDRLRNGIYGDNVVISKNEEVYRIMLARALSNKFTRVVFVPGELITYFAFKFHNNGVGKSHLDEVKILSSLRAILLYSKVMAMVKNSISSTTVNLTIDEDDPDPLGTIEQATHEVFNARRLAFPVGINSHVDIVDFLQRAALNFTFEGNPNIPSVKMDFQQQSIEHRIPDEELDELLRKQSIMAFGLSPETVDSGFSAEFATTVISNNILLSKRISIHQDILNPLLSDYIKKITLNDSILLSELMDVLVSNKALVERSLTDEDKVEYGKDPKKFLEIYLERVIGTFTTELPRPDITSIETQSVAFKGYSEALDDAMDAVINGDWITSELVGDINGSVDAVKAAAKAVYLRRWMSDNGYMTELSELTTADEDGNPNMDIYDLSKSHIEALLRSTLKYMKNLRPIKDASDQDIQKLDIDSSGSSESSDSSSDDSSDDSVDGGDDFGGDDLFGDAGGDAGDDDTSDGTEDKDKPDDTAKDEGDDSKDKKE